MSTVHTVFQEGPNVVAVCERVLVTYAGGEIGVPYLDAATDAGRALGRRFPRSVGSLTLVPRPMTLPDDDVRAAARRQMRESNAWVKAAATVIAGGGFWNAAARGALTGINFLSRGGPERRVYDRTDEAIEWLRVCLDLPAPVAATVRLWADEAMRRAA